MKKNRNILKQWKRRYYVLFEDALTYFNKGRPGDDISNDCAIPRENCVTPVSGCATPLGRIFISDITDVERLEMKRRQFCMVIKTNSKVHTFSCNDYQEREDWLIKMIDARILHKRKELTDNTRKRSVRLGNKYKRVTIRKDPKYGNGIGCSINNIGGSIYVSKILKNGPVASAGVLRPGDEIIDINGIRVSKTSIEEVQKIIECAGEYIVSTVKPVTHYSNDSESPTLIRSKTAYTRVSLSELDPNTTEDLEDESVDLDENKVSHKKGND